MTPKFSHLPGIDSEFVYMSEQLESIVSRVRQVKTAYTAAIRSRFFRDVDSFIHDLKGSPNPNGSDLLDFTDRFHSLKLLSEKILGNEF